MAALQIGKIERKGGLAQKRLTPYYCSMLAPSTVLTDTLLSRLQTTTRHRRLLLTEGFESRTIEAARELAGLGVGEVELLVPHPLEIGGVRTTVCSQHPNASRYADNLLRRRRSKGMTEADARALIATPLYLGAALLEDGQADAAVSGAHHTTADVIRAGIHTLERAPSVATISSLFLITLPDGRTLTYADCGVVPYPTARELADIALCAAQTHTLLTGEPARVGFLSFSTHGSATHERVQLVRDALAHFRALAPAIEADGELQFDAAFVPAVAARKCPKSTVAGRVNVFIFPNLDAGNIGYKMTERLGGAKALGPILRGFSRPWLDLSRGCSVADIVGVALVGLTLACEKSS